MSDILSDDIQSVLPTLNKLGASIPADLDVTAVASEWARAFSQHISSTNIDGILGLLNEDSWWRDMLALTWDFRTFHGLKNIKQFLEDRLSLTKLSNVKFIDATLEKPYSDIAWIRGRFSFETDVGLGDGVFHLIPLANGTWKAFTVYTNLWDLKGFPELTGANRNPFPNHGKWKSQREKEVAFADSNPQVLILGGGQSGLDVAARLKYLGVSTLIIEKQARIGDQWRNRYEALCLHDPVWFDHLPYIPFPPTWPVYTPAQKLADWLESYAHSLELNVWTSTTVTHAEQDENLKWNVTVKRADGSERTFHVDHFVFAAGLGGGLPAFPDIPGQEEFQGQILHSTQHHSAKDHLGKKVVIIGACTSAHDIAADYVENGVDVTIYQRGPSYVMSTKVGMPIIMGANYWEGSPPTELADRFHNSLPINVMKGIWQRQVVDIVEGDKALLEGLHKVGFKTYNGPKNLGFYVLGMSRGGGYYLDVGASKLIIDGKIKLKNDSPIAHYTKTGLKFEDGSELEADVILCATGFAGPRGIVDQVCGTDVGARLKPIWGLNEEGELRSAWRDVGIPNLWYMMGNLQWCRFHSKHIALQIKAQLEGVFGTRYVDE